MSNTWQMSVHSECHRPPHRSLSLVLSSHRAFAFLEDAVCICCSAFLFPWQLREPGWGTGRYLALSCTDCSVWCSHLQFLLPSAAAAAALISAMGARGCTSPGPPVAWELKAES